MDRRINFADIIEEKIDENLFLEFMKKVAIWDYVSISRQNYLALLHQEKEKVIKQYY